MSSHPTSRLRCQRWLLAALALVGALLASGVRGAEDQFLEPEKAFRLSVRAAGTKRTVGTEEVRPAEIR